MKTWWSEFRRDFAGLGWIAGSIAGGLILGLPFLMILLGL